MTKRVSTLGIALLAVGVPAGPLPDLSKGKSPFTVVRERPLVAERTEEGDFTRELIRFQFHQGDPINAFLIRPKSNRPRPVSLFLYSFPSSLDRFLNDDYCRRVTSSGMAVLGFQAALDGERYRNRPMKQWFVSELPESFHRTVIDVQFLIDYLQTRADIDASRIGFFGQGSGGSIGVLAAATDPRIDAVDILNPWGSWQDWMPRTSSVGDDVRRQLNTPAFLQKISPFDPKSWWPRVKTPFVRIQYVANEPMVPTASQAAMLKSAPQRAERVQYKDNLELMRASSNGKLFQWLAKKIGAN